MLTYLVPLSTWELRGVAVAAIMILAAVNMLGVSLGSGTLRMLVALKLGLLGFLVVWGFSGARRLVQSHPVLDSAAGIRRASAGPGHWFGRGLHRIRGLVGRQQARGRST